MYENIIAVFEVLFKMYQKTLQIHINASCAIQSALKGSPKINDSLIQLSWDNVNKFLRILKVEEDGTDLPDCCHIFTSYLNYKITWPELMSRLKSYSPVLQNLENVDIKLREGKLQ